MTTIDESILTAQEREIYAPRADVLIPDAEGMPAASAAAVHTHWIDEALAARPDLVNDFREALAIGGGDPAAAVEQLHKTEPELFDAFSVLTAGAYLMNPDVKTLIGYPGQEERPITSDDVGDYFDLLERVVERGPVHRPTLT
jgi:hypothetical protein